MPLIALGSDGNVIDSTNCDDGLWASIHKVRPIALLTCRGCSSLMSAVESVNHLRFFRHVVVNEHCPSYGESQAHLKLKKFIAHILRQLGAEPSLEALPNPSDQGGWRADVLVMTSTGSRIAFEAQLSSMTVEEGLRRTDRYARDGIETIWVTTKHVHWLNDLPGVRIAIEGEMGFVDRGLACLTVFGRDYEEVELDYKSVHEKSLSHFFEPRYRRALPNSGDLHMATWGQVETSIDFQSMLQGLLIGTVTSTILSSLQERVGSRKIHSKDALVLVSKRSKTEAEKVHQEGVAEQERQRVIREEREAELQQRIGTALSRHDLEEDGDFPWRQRQAPHQPNRSTSNEQSGRPTRIVPQAGRTLAVTEAQLRVLERALTKIRAALGQGIPLWIGPPSQEWDGKFPVKHPGFKTTETEGFGLSIWSGIPPMRLVFEAIVCPVPEEISLGLGGFWRSQGTKIYVETQSEAQRVAKSLNWLLDSLVITGL